MKRLVLLCGVIAALVFFSGALSNVSAGGGATVITDVECQIIPPDWGGPMTLFTTDVHIVKTPSGNVKATCHFDIPEGNEPSKAKKFNGFVCQTGWGATTNSQSVVTPGGNINLQCMIKAHK